MICAEWFEKGMSRTTLASNGNEFTKFGTL